MIRLVLFAVTLAGCAGPRESRASREKINCVYEAQYGAGNFTQAQRDKMAEACLK